MRYREFRIVEADAGETDPDNPTQGELDDIAGAKSANETLRAGPPYPPAEMDAVKEMQSRLEELGYSVGNTGVDGKYGPRTTRAVRAFKTDNNISTEANEMSGAELEKLRTAEKVESPTPTGNENQGGSGSGGTVIDLPDPDGNGGTGQLRMRSGAAIELDGNQSRMTQGDAGREMQATIRMARRMAGLFGKPITINDAIAQRGTSRERDTQGSQHFHGTALDLDISNYSDEEKLQLVNAALQAGFSGFGFGNSVLHVDRGPRRYWAYGNATYGGVNVANLGATVTSGRAIA